MSPSARKSKSVERLLRNRQERKAESIARTISVRLSSNNKPAAPKLLRAISPGSSEKADFSIGQYGQVPEKRPDVAKTASQSTPSRHQSLRSKLRLHRHKEAAFRTSILTRSPIGPKSPESEPVSPTAHSGHASPLTPNTPGTHSFAATPSPIWSERGQRPVLHDFQFPTSIHKTSHGTRASRSASAPKRLSTQLAPSFIPTIPSLSSQTRTLVEELPSRQVSISTASASASRWSFRTAKDERQDSYETIPGSVRQDSIQTLHYSSRQGGSEQEEFSLANEKAEDEDDDEESEATVEEGRLQFWSGVREALQSSSSEDELTVTRLPPQKSSLTGPRGQVSRRWRESLFWPDLAHLNQDFVDTLLREQKMSLAEAMWRAYVAEHGPGGEMADV